MANYKLVYVDRGVPSLCTGLPDATFIFIHTCQIFTNKSIMYTDCLYSGNNILYEKHINYAYKQYEM